MEIARICDGKRGHENQSLGLVEALARLTDVRHRDLRVDGNSLLRACRLAAASLPPLQLVIGAGHGTHLPLLVVARRTAARSVVLMKPTLPRRLFDLCIVPVHDGTPDRTGTLLSLGALNRVRPASQVEPDLCLVLIGGPSRHNAWDDEMLVAQVGELRRRHPAWRLCLVTSRRTPATTLARLAPLPGPVQVMPFDTTDADWLASTLPRAGTVWVSEDSVSMAYEAASAGTQLGLLEVPGFRAGRTRRALQALLDGGYAVSFGQWRAGRALQPSRPPLAEADRCARAILQRWPELS